MTMTPEQIKRQYQEMLNDEIFLNDPIAWMREDSEFIVMTAQSRTLGGAAAITVVIARSPCAKSPRASGPG
jgi:hypothetical protein